MKARRILAAVVALALCVEAQAQEVSVISGPRRAHGVSVAQQGDQSLILTVKHVGTMTAVVHDGRRYAPLRTVRYDREDLQLVWVPVLIPTISLGERNMQTGDPVHVSGTPGQAASQLGGAFRLSRTLRPGDSGRPVTDAKGRLVGIVSAAPSPLFGPAAEGIGLAVPWEPIRDFFREHVP